VKKGKEYLLLLTFIITTSLSAQVGTLVGWGMSICNTYSFNICPSQTITPLNYGSQTWVCNSTTLPDVSFTTMGAGWRVAKHNYTFTANGSGQITGFSPLGAPQSLPFTANQTITPISYPTVNSVVFAINGVASTFTFNQNTFSISLNSTNFSSNTYTICANSTTSAVISPVTPTVGGPWSYTWQPGNVSGSPITVSPTVSTIYTVTAASGTSCPNTVTVAVTVTTCCTAPIVNVSASTQTVCAGQQTTLSAFGAGSYVWSPGNMNGNSIVVSPTATTIYTVTGMNGVNCTSTKTIQISVSPSPTLSITNSGSVCVGQAVSLTGSGATTYTWTGANGFNSAFQTITILNAQASNAGVYTLTASNALGCIGSSTTNLVVNSLPNVLVNNPSICIGGTINLTASGGNNYMWQGPLGYSSNQQNPSLTNAQQNMSGIYTVTVTSAVGCSVVANSNVSITSQLLFTVSATPSICANGVINFNAYAMSNPSYLWTGPNGFTSTAQNPTITNAQQNASGVYNVSANIGLGCSSSSQVAVFVRAAPLLTILSDKLEACVPFCINVTGQSNIPLQNCVWQFASMDSVLNSLNPISMCYTKGGNHKISASYIDVYGCVNTSSIVINAYTKPEANFNYLPVKPQEEEPIEFTDASTGATITKWNWFFAPITNQIYNTPKVEFIYENGGFYQVVLVVESNHGCLDTIIKSIVVDDNFSLYVPNSFTPNGDGLNDTFQPKGRGILKYELTVFDRWGEQLYATKDFHQGWKGTKNGNDVLKEDTYVWKILITGASGKQKEYIGHVTLIK
jgi:gliding motility-associated-like protein